MKKRAWIMLWLLFAVSVYLIYHGGYRQGYAKGAQDQFEHEKSPEPNDGESPGDTGG